MFEIPSFIIYVIFFLDFFIAFFFLTLFIKAKMAERQNSSYRPEITFVLPAYNIENVLGKAVDSIKKVRYPQNKIKIIIVNDGSKDKTLEVARGLAKKYENILVLDKKNQGVKAYPVNFGIRHANTELVAVLDGDTLLKEDMLEKAIPLFDKNTMAVTARMKPLNNNNIIEKLQDVEYTFAGFYRTIMGHINSLSVAPAFTIFRREFFLKHGYFDVDNLTEDLEMGMRIQSKHYNIGYVASSYAITDVPETFRKLMKQRLRWAYGTLFNYNKYKDLFFNPNYGDLGIFILPAGFLSIMIMSLVFLAAFYTLFDWAWKKINLLFLGWQPSMHIDFNQILIYLTEPRIVLFVLAILVGLLIFFLIRMELNEKIKLRYYFLYLTVYLWMLGFFYIISFFNFILKRKVKW
jgi:cellulose synthase/poly-beta-1,6-N-acetylglucosamine synthase-like glycosyltransferase